MSPLVRGIRPRCGQGVAETCTLRHPDREGNHMRPTRTHAAGRPSCPKSHVAIVIPLEMKGGEALKHNDTKQRLRFSALCAKEKSRMLQAETCELLQLGCACALATLCSMQARAWRKPCTPRPACRLNDTRAEA